MALVLCPECRTEVSSQALQCPRCAYPIGGGERSLRPGSHDPSATPTWVSRRFAVGWTVATGLTAMFTFMIGRGGGTEEAAVFALLAILASSIPIWWKTRGPPPTSVPADLERRLEERMQEAEEQIRRRLDELEDGSRQVVELEERVDFAERLLAKYRDDQVRQPRTPNETP